MKEDWKYILVGTLISWMAGWIGADRIYRGEVGLGILKLVTLGGVGIWYLVDAFIWTYQLGKALSD
ncbi:MAG TPA: TM2 domain-containing protein [Candidatus Saccharimonadales bacterium]|nr:TM2 domain-containing protein [Candidatus Saccharimonadales bacterium]